MGNTFFFKDTKGFPSLNKERVYITGQYPKDIADHIVSAAKKRGINPDIPLAMGAIESKLQRNNPNIFNLDANNFKRVNNVAASLVNHPSVAVVNESTVPESTKEKALRGIAAPYYRDAYINDSLDYLAKGMKKYPNNPAKAIQFFNGEGKVRNLHGIKGVVNMKENPIYGNKVLDLAERFYQQYKNQ